MNEFKLTRSLYTQLFIEGLIVLPLKKEEEYLVYAECNGVLIEITFPVDDF